MIDNYMKSYKTHKYIDVLPDLVNNYNDNIHSSIKMKPKDVKPEEEEKIYEIKLHEKNRVDNNIIEQFSIGDKVRILKQRSIFGKGQSTYYSKQVYTIMGKEYNSFIVKSDNGKTKQVQPYMIKKISEIIDNPFINKTDKAIKTENTKFKNNKIKVKGNKELSKEGIQKSNIFKAKTRSAVRKK